MALVSSDGWEAILRDAAIRWSVSGTESIFQGDVSVEKIEKKTTDGALFGLRCFGHRVCYDKADAKKIDDNLFSIFIPLPSDCAAMWTVLSPRKVRGRTTRAVWHRIHFPKNQSGLDYIQVTVQVFEKDTTPSNYFDAALTHAKLETYAEAIGKGNKEFMKHEKHCECKLCIRQALRSNRHYAESD